MGSISPTVLCLVLQRFGQPDHIADPNRERAGGLPVHAGTGPLPVTSGEAGKVDEPTTRRPIGQWRGPRPEHPGPGVTNDRADRDAHQVGGGGQQGRYHQRGSRRSTQRNDQPRGGIGANLAERNHGQQRGQPKPDHCERRAQMPDDRGGLRPEPGTHSSGEDRQQQGRQGSRPGEWRRPGCQARQAPRRCAPGPEQAPSGSWPCSSSTPLPLLTTLSAPHTRDMSSKAPILRPAQARFASRRTGRTTQ
jgi:hypothetical protein